MSATQVEANIVRVPGLETLDRHLGVSDVLAAHRTRMASERTLLSWIRTAISMITFGFTIAKLAQYAEAGLIKGMKLNAAAPVRLGLTLVAVATVALCAALVQHELFARGLPKRGPGRTAWDLASTTAAFIVLLGILILASFLFRVGPF